MSEPVTDAPENDLERKPPQVGTGSLNVLGHLNEIRAILFGPPIGSRLLLNEDTRLTLASHLNAIQHADEDHHRAAAPLTALIATNTNTESAPLTREEAEVFVQQLVPDLGADKIEHPDVLLPDGTPYERPSQAVVQFLYYIAEHDRPSGVGMDELMREFGLSIMRQGRVAIAMKDSVRLGHVEQVAPRGDQYRWRVTEHGAKLLDVQRQPDVAPDPAELAQWAVEAHSVGNAALQSAEPEEEG